MNETCYNVIPHTLRFAQDYLSTREFSFRSFNSQRLFSSCLHFTLPRIPSFEKRFLGKTRYRALCLILSHQKINRCFPKYIAAIFRLSILCCHLVDKNFIIIIFQVSSFNLLTVYLIRLFRNTCTIVYKHC